MRRRSRVIMAAVAGVASAAIASVGLATTSASAATTYPVTDSFALGFLGHTDAATSPPGANVAGCHSQHPPLVLVHGTWENQDDNWQGAAPWFANHGYCVYTFNYGDGPTSNSPSDHDITRGTHDISESADQLNAEITAVLARTGAPKVDLLGHSQGGMMPREYIRKYGGAKIDTFVALAPSNNGTTLSGITALGQALGILGTANSLLGQPNNCPACVEQEVGSPFITRLNAGGETVPGVRYVVIETNGDQVVTPWQNAFLTGGGANVANIQIQQVCPTDLSEHLQLAYDSNAFQIGLNAFNGDPLTSITQGIHCDVELPYGI